MEELLLLAAGALALCGAALYGRKLRRGGCCGARKAPEKRVPVRDRDPNHYPEQLRLTVDGMTCAGCVRRVENALNRLPGAWAQAELSEGMVLLRMKERLPEEQLRRAVREAGYTVLAIQ